MQKSFVTGIGILIIVIGGVLYFSQEESTIGTSNLPTLTLDTREVHQTPARWQKYENTQYNFSLSYPRGLVIKEYLEGSNVSTITFQNIEEGTGFQIFVTPYGEKQISEERFRRDVPSGVRTDLENITIDTVTGASFYSKDTLLGETREVWFINEGFLYEITSPRVLEAWLSEILKTWHFTATASTWSMFKARP